MKYTIAYYEMDHGAHIFAIPDQLYALEHIETDDKDKLHEHIISHTRDNYGELTYEKTTPKHKKMFGFDYTSHNGGVKITEARPAPKFKKL